MHSSSINEINTSPSGKSWSFPFFLTTAFLGLGIADYFWGTRDWPTVFFFTLSGSVFLLTVSTFFLPELSFHPPQTEVQEPSAIRHGLSAQTEKSSPARPPILHTSSIPPGDEDRSRLTHSHTAKDGTLFRSGKGLLRGHTTVICRENVSPSLGDVVDFYNELFDFIFKDIPRTARKKGLSRPHILTDELYPVLVRALVLELLKQRKGRRERLRSAYTFSRQDEIRLALERLLRYQARCSDSMVDHICGYCFGMSGDDFRRYRLSRPRD